MRRPTRGAGRTRVAARGGPGAMAFNLGLGRSTRSWILCFRSRLDLARAKRLAGRGLPTSSNFDGDGDRGPGVADRRAGRRSAAGRQLGRGAASSTRGKRTLVPTCKRCRWVPGPRIPPRERVDPRGPRAGRSPGTLLERALVGPMWDPPACNIESSIPTKSRCSFWNKRTNLLGKGVSQADN